MKKHAYLIMAHTQPELLKTLLQMLDDERNDIFIHVDKKATDYPLEEISSVLEKSSCVFTERTDVKWGSYSQIHCEMVLLKEAVKSEHSYYHLMSGMDLPIKNQDYIHEFFESHAGLEFVDEDAVEISEAALSRIKYKHRFFGKAGSMADLLGAVSVKGQKLLRVDRTKRYEGIVFQKGRNWFSITHGLATLVVEKEAWIQEVFVDSVCGDEVFLQTVARNSVFAENICNSVTMPEVADTRLIDWERGSNNNPYIFQDGDFEELINSTALFARKFDLQKDAGIVEELVKTLA